MRSLAIPVIDCEDVSENSLEAQVFLSKLLNQLALSCRLRGEFSPDFQKPRHQLKRTGQALIALAEATIDLKIDFAFLEDPRLLVTRSMITDGRIDVPQSDSIFLVEDGAKGLLGNGTYWLDKNGDKLDVPTVPKTTSSENHQEWFKGYLKWMTAHGVHESSSTMNRRMCQHAYNLSRVPDLEKKIPLLHITTCSYLMEYEGQEVERGEKRDMVKRLFSLQAQYGPHVKVKVWTITTVRIKKAELPDHMTIDTSGG
jgi:hypothetical protein